MYSLTQAGNITALAGVIGLIFNLFKIDIDQSELVEVLSAIVSVTGIIISWVGRYRQGDISLGGFKK